MKPLLFVLIFLFSNISVADELKPFTSDGCSVFPDGTLQQQSLWAECCIRHDLAYWKGGTYDERLAADKALQACVTEIGEPEIASVMLAGVRVGGSPYFPTFYRWGYGWPYLRGYKAISDDDKQLIKQRLEQFKLLIDNINEQLD
jgi:hypothetical protein